MQNRFVLIVCCEMRHVTKAMFGWACPLGGGHVVLIFGFQNMVTLMVMMTTTMQHNRADPGANSQLKNGQYLLIPIINPFVQ